MFGCGELTPLTEEHCVYSYDNNLHVNQTPQPRPRPVTVTFPCGYPFRREPPSLWTSADKLWGSDTNRTSIRLCHAPQSCQRHNGLCRPKSWCFTFPDFSVFSHSSCRSSDYERHVPSCKIQLFSRDDLKSYQSR